MNIIFDDKERFLLDKLNNYYANHPHVLDQLKSILDGRSNISLRDINWFLTVYSKKHNTTATINDRMIHIHTTYENMSAHHKKKYFDVFRRSDKGKPNRFIYRYSGVEVETNVRQLNMFQFIDEYGILDIMKTHLKDIQKDMFDYHNMHRRSLELNDE